jgi:hypothetical protein
METTNTAVQISPPCVDERRALRALAGWPKTNIRVEVVPGQKGPTVRGNSWHYETRGGTVIDHPSAYSKLGWSNMIYVCSTIRVEIGSEWLEAWRKAGGVFAALAARAA